ncbi:MAG: trimethylamine methyltransferase family protein [Desulfobacterales bacterium]|nr:trimethylamine methyltransferase family protein [Desulfobacterales bacterium]
MTNAMQLDVLDQAGLDRMYEACIRLISEKGFKVDYEKGLKVLAEKGATVDFDTQMVRFSPELIESALKTAPREFTIKGQNPTHDFALPHPQNSFYTSTCVQTMQYRDPVTGNIIPVTEKNLGEWCQLAQVLPNIHKVAIQTPTDVIQEAADVHGFNVLLQNTAKPLMILAYCPESVELMFELLLAWAGSEENLRKRPQAIFYPTSLTPFGFKEMDIETMMHCCRYGVPQAVNSLAIAGATSPITIPGTAVLAAAEIIAMVVMCQLFKPGSEVIASMYATTMDVATGNALIGNAESMMTRSLAGQFMKKAFGLPIETFSFMTDSYVEDGQAVLEKSLMPAMLNLTGSDMQYGMGRLGSTTLASPVQMIIDNDLVSVIQRSCEQIEINDDTLAMDEMMETPALGNYVTLPHTFKHCRDNVRTKMFSPVPLDPWIEKGEPDLRDRAREQYQALKKEFTPVDLPASTIQDMNEVVKKADKYLTQVLA